MPYVPNTDEDRHRMVSALGLKNIQDLFSDIPSKHRFPELHLGEPLAELEIERLAARLAATNRTTSRFASFVGAGAYDHFIPAVVPAIASRGEFATSYTPYQPEVSQGTLQAIFEYQSLVAELIGVEVVNASHYDGATALAEAILMSFRAHREKRRKVVFAGGLHPEYREVVETYLGPAAETELLFPESEQPFAHADSPIQRAALVDESTACFVVSFPDFFGRLTDLGPIADAVHKQGALLIVHTNPVACALFASPGSKGADIVTGEGQPLGIPLSFGGPYLGLFGCTQELVRRMPGRLAGETVDRHGKRGYVLTLSTREQHIRREKATSNICTNQGLMALRAAVYLAALGPRGLREVAELCYHGAHYAAEEVSTRTGLPISPRVTEGPYFHEFVVRLRRPARELITQAEGRGVLPGLDLGRYFPHLANCLLVCVTEKRSRAEIDLLVEILAEDAK